MTGPLIKPLVNKQVIDNKSRKVWGKGPVRISDVDLDCYILMDGTAVLNKGKIMKAIGRSMNWTKETPKTRRGEG